MIQMMKKQITIKFISIITLASFMLTSVAGAGYPLLLEDKGEHITKNAPEFSLPLSLGRITAAKSGGNGPVVFAIEDLHCHQQVQKNISDILSFINQSFTIKSIYLEGAHGTVDTSLFDVITDAALRQRVVESLLASGELTGAEYYSITTGKPQIIKGMENEQLYKENLRRLGQYLQNREKIRQILASMENNLATVQSTYYNKQQKKFEAVIAKRNAGSFSDTACFSILQKYARRLEIDSSAYPNISLFLASAANEKNCNYKKISREISIFVTRLKASLPFSTYKEMVNNHNAFEHPEILAPYFAALPPQERRIFPHLEQYFEFCRESRAVNPIELVTEEEKLTREIQYRLGDVFYRKEVSFMSDCFRCYKDFFLTKISPDNYRFLCENINNFKLLWEKYCSAKDTVKLDAWYPLLRDFYQVNIQRNTCFADAVSSALT
jgi:hypothetical protein